MIQSLILLLSASIAVGAQNIDPTMVEMKVQGDLERSIGRILRPEQYAVQVTAQTETKKERLLLEGESYSQSSAPRARPNVPPLPGFSPTPDAGEEVAQNNNQTRQVYREVESQVLKSLQVFVQIDPSASDEEYTQAQTLARDYVLRSFPGLGRVNVSRVKLIRDRTWGDVWRDYRSTFFAFLGFLALLGVLYYVYRLSQKRRMQPLNPMQRYNEPQDPEARDVMEIPPSMKNERGLLPAPKPSKHAVDVKNDKFLPIPENPRFADFRTRLLESFLSHSGVFRHYWKRLSDDAQLEIFSALRGPALDNLLETLELERPVAGETSVLPSEEQLEFYEKNFQEFIKTFQWQNSQFFGFLDLLTYQQVLTLLKGENSLVGTFIIKYSKPEISAQLLNDLSLEKRSEVMRNFSRIAELSTEEMQAIELKVRRSAELLPHFIWTKQMPEVEFWERILSRSEDAEPILRDLQQSHPEIYQKLARFRFKLEDFPTLPSALIGEVFDRIDNEDLAKAFIDLGHDAQAFAFLTLPEARRKLVESQMLSLSGTPRLEREDAIRRVTAKFREVMV